MKNKTEKYAMSKEINEDDVVELAVFMHDEYENAARLYGWITQEKSRVPFNALPQENAKTMLHVAMQVIKFFALKNSSQKHLLSYERGVDDGERHVVKILCEEKKNHSPRSGAGRVLTYLLTKLGQQEDY